MDRTELYQLVAKFRNAIEQALSADEFDNDPGFIGFPSGRCACASELLAKYLHENGVETYYMSGQHGYGWESQNHAWLETFDGLVIDITRDQFKHKRGKLYSKDKVYVGGYDTFRKAFITDSPVLGYQEQTELNQIGESKLQKIFERRYQIISRYL